MAKNRDAAGSLFNEILNSATGAVCDRTTAAKALRGLCRWYGGQMVYLPKTRWRESKRGEEIFGVMADATDDASSEKIMDCITPLFGGFQIYVPFETGIFSREVAREIHERYDGTEETKNDLCREFHISFAKFYKLWHDADDDKRQLNLFQNQ